MVKMLERFWMQQDDSGIPFVAASQNMKDSVSMIRTKQLVQRNIDNFFGYSIRCRLTKDEGQCEYDQDKAVGTKEY
jgi:hypothetical protein